MPRARALDERDIIVVAGGGALASTRPNRRSRARAHDRDALVRGPEHDTTVAARRRHGLDSRQIRHGVLDPS